MSDDPRVDDAKALLSVGQFSQFWRPSRSGLDLRIQNASHWMDEEKAEVARLLGVDPSRVEDEFGGCDTCGYGASILVVDWMKS